MTTYSLKVGIVPCNVLSVAEKTTSRHIEKGKTMTTITEIIDELKTELASGSDIERIRDNSGEWVEGWIPVYNNRIIEEWQAMPSEYDDQGAISLGYDGDADIVHQMMLDLYLYYSDLFHQALDQIESELVA